MKIVLTGGGSGGHITPILAVADELKELNPEVELIYIGQKGDRLGDIPRQHMSISRSYAVRAGKFRRYHGQGILQIFDIPTLLKNIRDLFLLIIGTWQSIRLLKKIRPDVIYTPGGFVGVPVGVAARFRHVPFVTHDLDATPGLANRINAKWASVHIVSMPKQLYPYPPDKTEYLGVPVGAGFKNVSPELKSAYRKEIGLGDYEQVLLVTGGGLGAKRINEAIIKLAPALLEKFPKLAVVQIVGRAHEKDVKKAYSLVLDKNQSSRLMVKGYITDMHRYSGSADVIVMRAGATNMAEFALQGKAAIIIPNPLLTGGHQTKNVEPLKAADAAIVINENELDESQKLIDSINSLLNDSDRRQELSAHIAAFAKPNAAKDVAQLLIAFKSKGKREKA